MPLLNNMNKLYVLIAIWPLVSCSKVTNDCGIDLEKYDTTLRDVQSSILYKDDLDSLQVYKESGFNEIYRIAWRNGWTPAVYLTIGKTLDKYQILIDAESVKLNEFVRKVIEIERYEWDGIKEEIERTNFWCSRHYSGNIERGAMDGTWFYMEGIDENRYHAIMWQFDKERDRLLNRVLKAGGLLKAEPYISTHKTEDSTIYEFSVIPSMNTRESWLITDRDTIKSCCGELISIKLPDIDTPKIWEWKLIQITFDRLTNEIPLVEQEIRLARSLSD